MTWLATSTYSILRGKTTDAFGDPKDRDEAVETGVKGSVRLVRAGVTTESEGRAQTISYLVGRLPSGTDIQNGDRLQDEETGETFIVDSIDSNPRSPIMDTGVRLELRTVR
jgi:hypothetical protein